MHLEIKDVCKYFGTKKANDGICLTVESGTIHGVLGENGAGKSTLMKILAGYIRKTGGEILLDGEPVTRVVDLGIILDDQVVVRSGLKAGDLIVLPEGM